MGESRANGAWSAILAGRTAQPARRLLALPLPASYDARLGDTLWRLRRRAGAAGDVGRSGSALLVGWQYGCRQRLARRPRNLVARPDLRLRLRLVVQRDRPAPFHRLVEASARRAWAAPGQ